VQKTPTYSGEASFKITKPLYSREVALTPWLAIPLEINVGSYYSGKPTIGPYALDFLTIPIATINLDHHGGTVDNYEYKF
jgi:hypothetical protein